MHTSAVRRTSAPKPHQNTETSGLAQFRLAFLVLGVLLSSNGVSGEMVFRIGRACDGNGWLCAERIYAEGDISSKTAKNFRAFVQNHSGKAWTVSLDSPGGSLLGGMELGIEIRRQRHLTEILDEQTCASACAIAFLGGVQRSFDRRGRYGIHQFSSTSGSAGDGATQVTVAVLAKYLSEMGVSRELLNVASVVPPTEIYWVGSAERQQWRVDNSKTEFSGWRLDAASDGRPIVIATARYSGDKMQGSFLLYGRNGGVWIRIRLAASSEKTDRVKQLGIFLGKVNVLVDGSRYAVLNPDQWSVSGAVVEATMELPREVLSALATVSEIGLEFGIPNVSGDMRPDLKMTTGGLDRYTKTLVR